MVVIRCMADLSPGEQRTLEDNIVRQLASGAIVLPDFCELLHCGEDDAIEIIYLDYPATLRSITLLHKTQNGWEAKRG